MPRITVEFEEVIGDWGAQRGWVTVDANGAIPGLQIRRIAVFETDVGDFTFGMPLLQGELPGSRYSGIAFAGDDHRERFFKRLLAALRAARPDLFNRARRISPWRDSDVDIGGGDAGAGR